MDSNIVIGAGKGNWSCQKVLELGRDGRMELLTTAEVSAELGGVLPSGIKLWPPRATVKLTRDYRALKARIDKDYGGPGGTRREPSAADRSLVVAAAQDETIRAIISDDSSDLEWLYYNALRPEVRDRVTLLRSVDAARRFARTPLRGGGRVEMASLQPRGKAQSRVPI